MSMLLVVTVGSDRGRTFALSDGQVVVVGRSQETDFVLSDPHASRKHFMLEVDGGTVLLKDNASAGGVFVNGERVTQKELTPGDVIRVGNTEICLRLSTEGNATTLVTRGMSPEKPPVTDLSRIVGNTIHKYRIEKELAQGNSGVVFLAVDTEKNRKLAIKVLWPEISKNEEGMHRFVRAMKTMFPIRHENLVRIYNAGKSGDLWWVAMEYVDGESLTDVIQRIGTAGMLDWKFAFRVAVHIARGLEAAYEHQIVHRNITPQNILIRGSDKVAKLGDMMLAKALEGTLVEQITRPGQLIGDVVYMSPERTGGLSDVDCRSDIYSLGATIYALLTGRPPFAGESLPVIISKIRKDEPEKPKKYQLAIADMFEGSVLQMLEKRPEDRYLTPSDLLKDLERIGKLQGIEV